MKIVKSDAAFLNFENEMREAVKATERWYKKQKQNEIKKSVQKKIKNIA